MFYRCDIATTGSCDDAGDWTSYATPYGAIANQLEFDPDHAVIYGAGGAGILRCDTSTLCNDAVDWVLYALSPTDTYSLEFDSTNAILYAGTGGTGLLKRCDTSTACDEIGDWSNTYDTDNSNFYSVVFDAGNNIVYAGSDTAGSGGELHCS